MCRSIGSPPTFVSVLGSVVCSELNRVAFPPAKIKTGVVSNLVIVVEVCQNYAIIRKKLLTAVNCGNSEQVFDVTKGGVFVQ